MALSVLMPTTIPTGNMLVPMFETKDINNNNHMDFLAFKKNGVSREVGIYDYVDENLVEIWSYRTSSSDELVIGAVMGNFSGTKSHEILLLCSTEKGNHLLLVDSINEPENVKKINLKSNINVVDIKTIQWGRHGQDAFVIIVGSPDRQLIVAKIKNQKVEIIQTIKNSALSNSYGSIKIASGNIDKDKSNDLIVVINGDPSEIYKVRPNGSFKPLKSTAPRVHYMPEQLFDMDEDGIDDIVFTTHNNKLFYITSLGTFSFPIDSGIVSFFKNNNNLFAINSNGEIIKYSLGAFGLEELHRTKSYFFSDQIKDVKSIFSTTFNHMIITHKGTSSEIVVEDLDYSVNHQFQTLGGGTADAIATAESTYLLNVEPEKENNFLFSSMEIDSMPSGMKFDIDKMRFDWTPLKSQLGFHSLSYTTIYKQSGDIQQDSSMISRSIVSTNDTSSILIYVNDPANLFKKEKNYTVVKHQTLNIQYKIDDKNIDAVVSSRVVGKNLGASFITYTDSIRAESKIDSIGSDVAFNSSPIDSLLISSDSLSIALDSLSNTADTALTSDALDSNLVNLEASEKDSIGSSSTYVEQLINHPNAIERFAHFEWTPNVDPGQYKFTLAATDQITEDSLTINVNVHPIIDLSKNKKYFTTTTNREFSYLINVEQSPRSSQFTYSISDGPDNINVDKNGKIYWIPSINQVDTNNVSIVVYDEHAKSVYEFSVYVNDPPYITSLIPSIHTINTTDSVRHQMKFLDLNANQEHVWSVDEGPVDMILNSSGLIEWAPKTIDFTDLVISVTDKIDTTSFKSTIYVNDIPKIVSSPSDIVNVNEKFSYQIEVVDNNQKHHINPKEAPELSHAFVKKSGNMTLSDSSVVEWIPNESELGWNEITLVVDDGVDKDFQTFNIFVNSKPVLTLDDSLSIELGDTLDYTINVEDKNDEDTVQITYNGNLNLVVDNKNHSFRLIPESNNVGLNTVKLLASDGHPESVDTKEIKVLLFTRPELVSLPPKEAFLGIEYVYTPVFVDMLGSQLENENIKLTKTSSKNMQLDPALLSFSWIPDSSDVGLQHFEFEATDQFGVQSKRYFEIETYLNPCPPCEVERNKDKKQGSSIAKKYWEVESEKKSTDKLPATEENGQKTDSTATVPAPEPILAPSEVDTLKADDNLKIDSLKTISQDTIPSTTGGIETLKIEPKVMDSLKTK